jgi:hypothetical protein
MNVIYCFLIYLSACASVWEVCSSAVFVIKKIVHMYNSSKLCLRQNPLKQSC